MYQFNRQVLEQVAKDGRTYASLAKEMAKALLDGSQAAETPQNVRGIFLHHQLKLTPAAREELDAKGLYIFMFEATGVDTDISGDSIYLWRIVKPGEPI